MKSACLICFLGLPVVLKFVLLMIMLELNPFFMSNEVLSQISSKIKTSENSKEMFKNRGNRFACVKMVSA